jgi:hypothetical protein
MSCSTASVPGEEGKCFEMKLCTLLRREMQMRGIRTIREAARLFGVSGELTRRILNLGLIPKDRTLVRIAAALDLDPAILITAGHRQKLPRDLREQLLPVAPPTGGGWEQKRKWPLSQEQCEYLGREMKPHEIQLMRKARQLTPEEKTHLIAYIEYMFATQRVPPPVQREALQTSYSSHNSAPEAVQSMECGAESLPELSEECAIEQ